MLLGQVIAVDMPLSMEQEEWEPCRGTNIRLPDDVAVTSFEKCHESFDPRHDAILK
jgi:tRNA U38,U39,U40 pseudouridine synthase TruA